MQIRMNPVDIQYRPTAVVFVSSEHSPVLLALLVPACNSQPDVVSIG